MAFRSSRARKPKKASPPSPKSKKPRKKGAEGEPTGNVDEESASRTDVGPVRMREMGSVELLLLA